ncbi:MAG: hypothetical protein M1827_007001 [Pycnora praestabilis]|nr:MAG: hypothetical protein M1827_007001 [Pycnora praestabilis]
MSFLNSALASIGTSGEQRPIITPIATSTDAVKPVQEQMKRTNISTNASNTNNQTNRGVNTGQKRKAEDDLQRIIDKTSRNEPLRMSSSRPIAHPSRPRPVDLTTKSTIPVVAGVSPGTSAPTPYRGTGKQAPSLSAAAASSPKAPPKKGSYAEILARAAANQTMSAQVGAIKHKPVEKLSKKERLAQEAQASLKPNEVQGKGRKEASDGKNQSGRPATIKPEEVLKKKPADLGYKGTARPRPEEPIYKGTMNRTSPALSGNGRKKGLDDRDRDRNSSRSRSTSLARPSAPRYRYAEDYDDDEEDEDGEEDVASDVSSDMEAGAFDLEEEEQTSLKTARKEDEEAVKEEMRLKKEKEDKRKRLVALAAKTKRR